MAAHADANSLIQPVPVTGADDSALDLLSSSLVGIGATLALVLLYPVVAFLAGGSSSGVLASGSLASGGFLALLCLPVGMIVTGATLSFWLTSRERLAGALALTA